MRTTVTLDPDVDQLIREKMRRTRKSFKATLNQAIRRGLANESRLNEESPFQVKARPLGVRAGVDPARFNQLADDLEVEAFLDATRKLRRETDGGA